MPGPPLPGDCQEDLIRTRYDDLESPDWWKATGAQGVVMYAWGAPRYLPIAQAIRQAGLKLVCNMDTSGTFGVLGGPFEYWGAQWRILNGLGVNPSSLIMFLLKFISSISWSLIKNDPGRARHLRQADLIGAVSPIARERIQRVCRWYGGDDLAARVALIPHPVSMHMRYTGQAKQPRVVCVGRWQPEDWRQKNPRLLLQTLVYLLPKVPHLECVVVGSMEENLRRQFLETTAVFSGRVRLPGRMPNHEIAPLFQTSQVALCTSNHESFHIASAEALCCGCSLVAPDLPELPSLKWFVGESSGRLASRTPEALAQAVQEELCSWRQGQKEPDKIAERWGRRLHADRVADQILAFLATQSESGSK
jgi:glycosyltransferase involved in cell wall biosynthesis